MTTKPSDAPWADEPIKLIPIPAKHLDENTHASVYSACMMAHVHNCLIRGLNAVIQQAPYIPTSVSPAYRPQDVKDLLFYVASWVRTVEHHHHTEETTMFPAIEEFAGEPGLMEGPKHQHEEFTPGLEKLLAYAQETKPEDYRWEGGGGMKDIIDGFTEPLTRHLFDEIDVFLGVGHLDTQGLRKCWDEAEKAAQAKGNRQILYDIFPLVLGTCDQTYDGGNDFPPLPWFMPYLIKYWFGRSHSGAWRFSPCDLWGRPMPLHFRLAK